MPSFLSTEWAVVADIDIESEKYRKCCGSNRFLCSAISRLVCLRHYQGQLSFLVEEGEGGGAGQVQNQLVVAAASTVPEGGEGGGAASAAPLQVRACVHACMRACVRL
jgi:hypothetical protein